MVLLVRIDNLVIITSAVLEVYNDTDKQNNEKRERESLANVIWFQLKQHSKIVYSCQSGKLHKAKLKLKCRNSC